jgi:hypothetical protein
VAPLSLLPGERKTRESRIFRQQAGGSCKIVLCYYRSPLSVETDASNASDALLGDGRARFVDAGQSPAEADESSWWKENHKQRSAMAAAARDVLACSVSFE